MSRDPSPPSPELSEEQRERAEANRLRALAKRKAYLLQHTEHSNQHHPEHSNQQLTTNPHDLHPTNECGRLFKCQKLNSEPKHHPLFSGPVSRNSSSAHTRALSPVKPASPCPDGFRVRLEICSPTTFAITPQPTQGFHYPGDDECFQRLDDWLSNVMSIHYTQNNGGGKASVYKLKDYDVVLRCLKISKGVEIEEIPWATYNVVEKFSHGCDSGHWIPCRPEHLPDSMVEQLIEKLPRKLLDRLLPFQTDGLRFGLQRGGRCLIADEMGLGKTLQAIAIASCFLEEGPILVVCPAILRFSWADELERWLPFCLPSDIHLVFGHQNNPAYLVKCPKVVVTSYKMLHRLRTSMLEFEWATLIVDESHHVRCSKKKSEPGEIKAVLDVAEKVKHIILLSGTPSLSRPFDIFHQINMLWPGLLGKDKYEFAKTYCSVKFVQISQGKTIQDFSQGSRLEELNILLRQTVMIRRLKAHLLVQLPPKRRQIIRLLLRKADIVAARNAVNCLSCDNSTAANCSTNDRVLVSADRANDTGDDMSTRNLSHQVLGIAKVPGFLEWLSLHPIITELDDLGDSTTNVCSRKMIIFAHHHKVLDKVQEFVCEKKISFVRIDGNTLDRDRQSAVNSFQSAKEVKIAMIGIEVGYAGINLSAAQTVVFLEIPKKPTDLIQAEDRAHRRGQMNSVNIYIFCAMDTVDESRWQRLNKSLHGVSSMTDGKYDAQQEIAVERVCFLKDFGNVDQKNCELPHSANAALHEHSDVENVQYLDGSNCKRDQVDKGCERSQNILDNMPEKLVEACSPIQASFLRFAVSQYTGRIHLCSCIPGVDSRPRPLSDNFMPEEIISGCNTETAGTFIEDNSSYRGALVSFVNEWEKLKRHERRKLLGKALQLPLSVELSCLNESTNHDSSGLLKSGSRKRTTPLCDLSSPLPPNAMWKDVKLGGGCRKKEITYMQAWTLMNEPLCKLCQNPCKGVNSMKPEYFEDLFCKLECYEEYRSRTSNRFLRQELFRIEHGICTNCQLDCHKLVQHIRPLTLANREEYVKTNAPNIATHKKLFDRLVFDPTEGNAWHADHIVPVYRGGGECRVDNLRTLCVACHADVTTAQCAERRLAKKHLQMAITDRKKSSKLLPTRVKPMEEHACIIVEDETADDELLISVPGSAYSDLKRVIGAMEKSASTSAHKSAEEKH